MWISMTIIVSSYNQILTAKHCFALLLFTQQWRGCRIPLYHMIVFSCPKIEQSRLEKYKQSNHLCLLIKPLRHHQWTDAVAHDLT